MTIIVAMVGVMQFYVRKGFSDYIHKVEALRLRELSLTLGREYRMSSGWERMRDDPERWHELLRPGDSAAYAENLPLLPSGYASYMKQPPRAPEKPREGAGRPDNRYQGPGRRDPNGPGPERRQGEGGAGRSGRPVFEIEHRITLFDDRKIPVTGGAESAEDHTLQEIAVDGRTVGWLGLRNEKRLSDPLDVAFLKQQSLAYYWVGAFALVLAAVAAFFLARHLLLPVQALTAGTRNLTSRIFATRIHVRCTDELGQLAADFNRMAETLQRYERMRQQWISDISHELRTPLSILRGEIEALQDGIRTPNPEHLASLHAEVLHLIHIVRDLHDLSLAESGMLSMRKVPVDPVKILRECFLKFQDGMNGRGIRVMDALGDMETTILGDRDRLTQVFSNLLENTLRYTDTPGTLTVRSETSAGHMILEFADTPPGVPADALDRLFERLYRVDPSRSRALGGSGLGLSICRTIIEAHGGTITARHAATGGLLIEIRLSLSNLS